MRRFTFVVAALLSLLPARVFCAADSISMSSVSANTTYVEVPIFIRDASLTPLGVDQGPGARIQAIAFKVKYDPTMISSIRLQYIDLNGGVLYGLNPLFSSVPRTDDSISFLASYTEATAPIAFDLDAPAPGNLVARLVINLKPGLAEGTHIPLLFDDAATSLSNQAGAISESKTSGTLEVTNGEIVVVKQRSPRKILPAVASTPGQFGALFRTTLQLVNPTPDQAIFGRIVFHPAGQVAAPSDPSATFIIGSQLALQFDDLLTGMGAAGIGSADVYADSGPLPIVISRVFNDSQSAGTTGMYEDVFTDDQALQAGQHALLVTPPDPVRMRFNIGVKTLDQQARIDMAVLDKNGFLIGRASKFFDRDQLVQVAAGDLLGFAIGATDSIYFDIISGTAIIYGSAVDNTSQDPSWQTAVKVPAGVSKAARPAPRQ